MVAVAMVMAMAMATVATGEEEATEAAKATKRRRRRQGGGKAGGKADEVDDERDGVACPDSPTKTLLPDANLRKHACSARARFLFFARALFLRAEEAEWEF